MGHREHAIHDDEVGNAGSDSAISTFYMPGGTDYDSDATVTFFYRYPHEDPAAMTWACEKML